MLSLSYVQLPNTLKFIFFFDAGISCSGGGRQWWWTAVTTATENKPDENFNYSIFSSNIFLPST
jgi:hypothetical protein